MSRIRNLMKRHKAEMDDLDKELAQEQYGYATPNLSNDNTGNVKKQRKVSHSNINLYRDQFIFE